jgi:hypothetical protein
MVAVLFTLMSIIPTDASEPGCYDPKYTAYNDIVNQAINNCPNRKPEKVDRDLIWSLVVIEESFSPPPELRGMLLAAACRESGYDPSAKGDRKFSKKRKPKAIGLLQFWPWAEKYIDRTNPIHSAKFWMKRIVKQLPSVRKKCKWKSKKRRWIAAWVTAIRYPKKSGRCYEKAKHYYLLRRWQKNIKKDKKP